MKFNFNKKFQANVVAEPIMADGNTPWNTDCKDLDHFELVVQVKENFEDADWVLFETSELESQFNWTWSDPRNEDHAETQARYLAEEIKGLHLNCVEINNEVNWG
jgi:hypothetical protein